MNFLRDRFLAFFWEHSHHCSAVARVEPSAHDAAYILTNPFLLVRFSEEISERFVERHTKRRASNMQQSSWDVGVGRLVGSSRFSMRLLCWCSAATPSRLWSCMRCTRHATSSFSFSRCKFFYVLMRPDRWHFGSAFRASGDLQAILDEDGSLTEQNTRLVLRETLKALDYLHRRNVAHLDIKPQNILLNSNNLDGKKKILIQSARPWNFISLSRRT